MTRHPITPRPDWEKTVESQGFHFHTAEDEESEDAGPIPYWDESAYYHFTSPEIDAIEAATYALDEMCLSAVQYVIDENLFPRFQIPEPFVPWIKRSWDTEEFTLYARYDLAYDGSGPPKMLEYNADTPTALLEASVIQWHWMRDKFHGPGSAMREPGSPEVDQYNSIHEKLIAAWKRAKPTITDTMYFTGVAGHIEDFLTVT